jgi:hypothetical protein
VGVLMIVPDRFHSSRNPRRGNDNAANAEDFKPAGDLSDERSEGEPDDAGMTTAEYAIGTLAACAFATVRRSTS